MPRFVTEGIPGMNYTGLKESGASGVIFPVRVFSSGSFVYYSEEILKNESEKAREAGLSVYWRMTRLFAEEEIDRVRSFLEEYAEAPDGIYYTDPCVYVFLKETGQTRKGIFAEDTLTTNARDIQRYLDLGIARCLISPECTKEEVLSIAEKVKNTEILVYGPLSLAKSRRPFLTSYGVQSPFTAADPTGEYAIRVVEEECGTTVFEKDRLDASEYLPAFSRVTEYFQVRGFTKDEKELLEVLRKLNGAVKGDIPAEKRNGGFYAGS